MRVPWIVVEHSSNFASFTAGWKNRLGWLYDQIIGKRVFTYADVLIATSEVCRTFIKTFAKKKPIHLIYRGLVLEDMTPSSPGSLKEQFPGKIIMGVLGRLVYRKNIHGCIQAYYSLPLHVQQRIQLVVV